MVILRVARTLLDGRLRRQWKLLEDRSLTYYVVIRAR